MGPPKLTVNTYTDELFEATTGINVPDTLNDTEKDIQLAYVMAAYMASHDIRITYARDDNHHAMMENCIHLYLKSPNYSWYSATEGMIAAAACNGGDDFTFYVNDFTKVNHNYDDHNVDHPTTTEYHYFRTSRNTC